MKNEDKIMGEKPAVKAGDWITFGNNRQAVVCNVYDAASFADIEIVFFDQEGRATNNDMVWQGDKWVFKFPEGSGGYADRLCRLSEFVEQLRKGQSAKRC